MNDIQANKANSADAKSRALISSALGVMKITTATLSDLDEAVGCLAAAFAQDPITGFLLNARERKRVTS